MMWLALVLVVLLAISALTVVVGYLLPGRHQVSRSRRYAAPPEQLFSILTGVRSYSDWRGSVKSVAVLPDDGRGLLFRERGGNGNVLYRFEVIDPPHQLISRIADPSLPYSGAWTYDLKRTGTNGTELTITEDGEVHNPLFRVVRKLFFSPYASLDTYLNDLGRLLNSPPPHGAPSNERQSSRPTS